MTWFIVENAIRLLTIAYPTEKQKKPSLFHSMRVGSYLFLDWYSEEICVAGLLHDSLEDTPISENVIRTEFGEWVLGAVKANSKNPNVPKEDVLIDIVRRCIAHSEWALIVKSADVLDNFAYYSRCKDEGMDVESELIRCWKIAHLITGNLPKGYIDPIFAPIRELSTKIN